MAYRKMSELTFGRTENNYNDLPITLCLNSNFPRNSSMKSLIYMYVCLRIDECVRIWPILDI